MAGETLQARAATVPTLCPQGEFFGKPDVVLSRPVTSVGSAETNRLHLRSRSVSRVHALFVNSGGATFIADLASRSGVLVNRRHVSWAQLKTGDRVQIGKFEFRFRAPPGMLAGPESPPPAELDIPDELPVPVASNAFVIGSRDSASICISHDPDVATAHAIIFPLDGRWHLRDLGSDAGTKLNGHGIHQHSLDFGDTIEIGAMKFRLVASVTPPVEPEEVLQPAQEIEMIETPAAVADEPLPLELDDLDFRVDEADHVDLSPIEPVPAAESIEPVLEDEQVPPEEAPPQKISAEAAESIEPPPPEESVPLEEISVHSAATIEPPPQDEPVALEEVPLEEVPLEEISVQAAATIEPSPADEPVSLEEVPLEEVPLEEISVQAAATIEPPEPIQPAESFAPFVEEPTVDQIAPPALVEPVALEEIPLEEFPVQAAETIEPVQSAEPAVTIAESEPLLPGEWETSDDEDDSIPDEIAPLQFAAPQPPAPLAVAPQEADEVSGMQIDDLAADEDFVAIPELDPADIEPAAPAQTQLPVGVAPVASQPPISPEPTVGPSVFGFKFEGGTFMGGRPLVLRQLPPTQPAAAIPPPPPKPVEAPAPAVAPPVSAAVVPTVAAAAAPPVAAAEPPRPAAPPPVPEIPSVPAAAESTGPFSARSLTDLFLDAPGRTAEAKSAEPPPKVATLSDAFAVPPLTKPVVAPPKQRRPLTTAFDGLSKPAAKSNRAPGLVGATSSNSDVFSQVGAPIGSDLFGASDPGDVAIPDIRQQPPQQPPHQPHRRTTADGVGVPPKNPNAALPPIGRRPSAPQHARRRRLAVPALVSVMILLLGGVWAVAYLLIPVRSKVVGTLAYSNLAAQSPPVQQAFEADQIVRLHSSDVRTIARSLLIAQQINPGWLDDPVQFDQILDRDGSAQFKDETLSLTLNVPDQSVGRAQVNALLTALSEKNADLSDALSRAHRQASDAHLAVDQASARLDQIKSQIVAERTRGEDRPDPAEIDNLEAQSLRLSGLLASARAARVDAEDGMAVLRTTNTAEPPSPQTDPQLLQLRQRLADLSQQMADRRSEDEAPTADTGENATTRPTRPDSDTQLQSMQAQADAVTSQINQRLAVLQEQKNLSPEQREVQRQKAIEDLSIKLTDLRKSEADAAAASQSAADNLRSAQTRLQNARSATERIDQLIHESADAQTELKARSDEAADADRQVNTCVYVSGQPQESVTSMPDQRPLYAGISSGVILLIFCGLIVTASRSTHAPPRGSPQPQPHDPNHPMPVQ